MITQVEQFAKHYLDGEPAEISEETVDELCEWIMTEFQQLPLAVEASDFVRYDSAKDMFADIEQDHLWESVESYDADMYPSPFYGFALAAIHDYDHYLYQADFSFAGEITAYNAIAQRAPSLEIQKILYSEIVLKSAAHLYLGHRPDSKIIFP